MRDTDRISWQKYFMDMAYLSAKRSTCLRRQVGAVAVIENHVIATGYNGAPKGVRHCIEIGCLREEQGIPSGERHELCHGVHAEQNLICQAASYGLALKGATIYCTHQPCYICAKMIINAGVELVIYSDGYNDPRGSKILGTKLLKLDGDSLLRM